MPSTTCHCLPRLLTFMNPTVLPSPLRAAMKILGLSFSQEILELQHLLTARRATSTLRPTALNAPLIQPPYPKPSYPNLPIHKGLPLPSLPISSSHRALAAREPYNPPYPTTLTYRFVFPAYPTPHGNTPKLRYHAPISAPKCASPPAPATPRYTARATRRVAYSRKCEGI